MIRGDNVRNWMSQVLVNLALLVGGNVAIKLRDYYDNEIGDYVVALLADDIDSILLDADGNPYKDDNPTAAGHSDGRYADRYFHSI